MVLVLSMSVNTCRVYSFSLWNRRHPHTFSSTQLHAHLFSSEIIQELCKMLKFSFTQRIRQFKANHMRMDWECKYTKNHSHAPWGLVFRQVYGHSPQSEWPRFKLPRAWELCCWALIPSLMPRPLSDFTRLMLVLRFQVTYCSLSLLACLHIFLMSGFCKRTCHSPCCGDNHCSLLFFFI